MTDTTITLFREGKTYERQGANPSECDGCAFSDEPVSHPVCKMNEHLCEGFIWIEQPQKESPLDMPGFKAQKAYNGCDGCCGQPNTCEQPCFHASGRTTPGQPGGIASVPQPLEEVRSSDDWVKWRGGMMPVTGMVEVRYRNGVTKTDDADSFLWDHRDYPDDIVAYRKVGHIPAPEYDPRDVSFNPLDKQVGGNHYRDMVIQPVEFIVANGIPYREANVIKYVVRHASKNGKQDLLKARHYIDMLIADYEDAE